MSLLTRFLIRCQQRVSGYRCALALIFGSGLDRSKESTVLRRQPSLGGHWITLMLSYLCGSSSLLCIRDIQHRLLPVESCYLVHLVYRNLLLYDLLLEALLVCVLVILLDGLTSGLGLEVLFPVILGWLYFDGSNFTRRWKW